MFSRTLAKYCLIPRRSLIKVPILSQIFFKTQFGGWWDTGGKALHNSNGYDFFVVLEKLQVSQSISV